MTHRKVAFPTPTLLAISVLTVVSTGCPSSGLSVYDDKGETTNEVEPPRPGETPPPIENCPELCAEAMDIYAQLGCDIDCDLDLGATFSADIDVAVINLLTLFWVDAEGDYTAGQTCDLVVRCPQMTPCQMLAIQCLNDSSNSADHCIDEYVQCEQETACMDIYNECTSNAWDAYEDCKASTDECLQLLDDMNQICNEQYAECLDIVHNAAPMPPLPRQTAATQWDVPRPFLRYHLQRLDKLAAETFTMLMPGPDGKPLGLAVHSLERDDALVQLGLQEGDIVAAVQGTPVVAFASKLSVLLELVRQPGAEITIVRKGVARKHRYRWVD